VHAEAMNMIKAVESLRIFAKSQAQHTITWQLRAFLPQDTTFTTEQIAAKITAPPAPNTLRRRGQVIHFEAIKQTLTDAAEALQKHSKKGIVVMVDIMFSELPKGQRMISCSEVNLRLSI
jgi:hypothetical protein